MKAAASVLDDGIPTRRRHSLQRLSASPRAGRSRENDQARVFSAFLRTDFLLSKVRCWRDSALDGEVRCVSRCTIRSRAHVTYVNQIQ